MLKHIFIIIWFIYGFRNIMESSTPDFEDNEFEDDFDDELDNADNED